MKILFVTDDRVHHFKVTGEIHPSDLGLLKQSLFLFFESDPGFVIVDLSEVHLQIPESELQTANIEITTLAKARGVHLAIAQTDIEVRLARRNVLESALRSQMRLLRSKIDLREKIRADLESLKLQNQTLRRELEEKSSEMARVAPESPLLKPWMERLWSDR